MTAPALSARRAHCDACARPQSHCICRWITPVAHEVPVLILQHPLEVAHPKGSARLLHLSLPRSQLWTGEVFGPAPASEGRQDVLLYPDTPQDASLGLAKAPPLSPALLQDPSRLRLVVLDGTWRKSRKMLYLNPWLQAMPRLALRDMPASRYRVRRAHAPDQLSTLEATCAALAQLEGGPERFEPLLAAFDGFVAGQLACVPPALQARP